VYIYARIFQFNIDDLLCYRYNIFWHLRWRSTCARPRRAVCVCVQKRDDFTTLTPIIPTTTDTSVLGHVLWVSWVWGGMGDSCEQHAAGSNRKIFARPSPRIRKRPTAIKHGLFGARLVVRERDDCGREYNNNIKCAVHRVNESPSYIILCT